jgi:hypothetical protein
MSVIFFIIGIIAAFIAVAILGLRFTFLALLVAGLIWAVKLFFKL